jgi:glycosyltransferase involved in cell wall biosynthesis
VWYCRLLSADSPGVTANQPVLVATEVVEPWIDLIERLEDDAEFYRAESERALAASAMYRPENLAPRYVEYFRGILGE